MEIIKNNPEYAGFEVEFDISVWDVLVTINDICGEDIDYNITCVTENMDIPRNLKPTQVDVDELDKAIREFCIAEGWCDANS